MNCELKSVLLWFDAELSETVVDDPVVGRVGLGAEFQRDPFAHLGHGLHAIHQLAQRHADGDPLAVGVGDAVGDRVELAAVGGTVQREAVAAVLLAILAGIAVVDERS